MDSTAPALRWGVLGTGKIADSFVRDLRLLPGAAVTAVGSRTAAGAEEFGARHGIGHRHGSYAALVADDDVDVVYVATPHPGHAAAALLAVEAGRGVLVEKPFTVDAAGARQVVAAARAAGVFCMEAMWTRFLPHVAAVLDLLAGGAVGDVRTVVADHGQRFARDPDHRAFAPALAGGALLDLGVYPVALAHLVLGAPAQVVAAADPAFTGVDAQTSMVLRYPGGAHALLTCTLDARTPTTASISGTAGRVEIASPWYRPSSFTVVDADGGARHVDVPHDGNGLRHQAAEVARCVAAGLAESPLRPLDDTLAVMDTLDEVRRQIGLVYPFEP